METISVKITIHGRKWLRAKYAAHIIARRDSIGQEWRIKKEPEGYIFRSIVDNTGIYGHSKTVEEVVLNALTKVSGITITVDGA